MAQEGEYDRILQFGRGRMRRNVILCSLPSLQEAMGAWESLSHTLKWQRGAGPAQTQETLSFW